jgi:hypothetical protein
MNWMFRAYKYAFRKQRDKSVLSAKKRKRGNPQYTNPSVSYTTKHLDDTNIADFSEKYMDQDPNLDFLLYETKGGVFTIFNDYITVGEITFHRDDIQWYGRYPTSDMVRLDINSDGLWYRLYLAPYTDKTMFFAQMLNHLPEKLKRSHYQKRPEFRTQKGSVAYITARNRQGIFKKHETVEFHITPLWMVVLHKDRVFQQHFIDDIKDIRCSSHPTDTELGMHLLTFEVNDIAYAYALKNSNFAIRLADAGREGIDQAAMRKKKKKT